MLDFSAIPKRSNPRVPTSKTNPIGQTTRMRKSCSAIFRDIRKVQELVLEQVSNWPFEIQNNMTANAFYDFKVDISQIEAIVDAIRDGLSRGDATSELKESVSAAYRQGVARAADNLAGLSSGYPRTVMERLGDSEVARRAATAASRTFEQMKGFADQTAKDLSLVLFEAIQDGQNPRATARKIRDRFKVSRTRAERIARTEITTAHRRGRWDEARDAEQKYGLKVMLLHVSALIPGRTRESHARRHGKMYTREETADWYSRDANSINCLCTQTEVVVDENGNPVFGEKLMDRMDSQRKVYVKEGQE